MKFCRTHAIKHFSKLIILTGALTSAVVADDDGFVVRATYSSLTDSGSSFNNIVGTSFQKRYEDGYYWGLSIFGRVGEGAGFASDGIEFGKITKLSDEFFVDTSMYLGGVNGADSNYGMMLRPSIALGKHFDAFALSGGVSWVKVTGSDISSPSLNLSLSKSIAIAGKKGHAKSEVSDGLLGLRPASFSGYYRGLRLNGDLGRTTGLPLDNMSLIGNEIAFSKGNRWHYYISLTDFATKQSTSEGQAIADTYTSIYFGARRYSDLGAFRPYAGLSLGLAGRGDADTGSGLTAMADVGVRIPLVKSLYTELSIGYLSSIGGDFDGWTPSVKLGFDLLNKNKKKGDVSRPHHWGYSFGLSHLPDYKASTSILGDYTSSNEVNFGFQYYMKRKTFISAEFSTSLNKGDSFHSVYMGLGHEVPIARRLGLAPQLYVLRAGGGVGWSALGRLDLEYALSDSAYFTFGGGLAKSLKSGGRTTPIVKSGFKFKFTTFD